MSGPTVAVIGAGFSGLLTTLNLLRMSPDVSVQLIERRGVFSSAGCSALLGGVVLMAEALLDDGDVLLEALGELRLDLARGVDLLLRDERERLTRTVMPSKGPGTERRPSPCWPTSMPVPPVP